MKNALATLLISAIGITHAGAQSLQTLPVHAKPTWQIVTGLPSSPGAPVNVRSLATNQVIGTLPVDSRFQSFGTNGQIMTFAWEGQVAYIPSGAASRLYPVAPKPEIPPAGRASLDVLAEEYEKRMTGDMGVSLSYSDSLQNSAPAQPVNSTGVAPIVAPGMPGVNPYAGQPGAALANGGVQGVGAMANPYTDDLMGADGGGRK